MGDGCSCINSSSGLGASEWIDIIAIVVNSLLAWWIVSTIQKRVTNKRVLKDHFISEVKVIRDHYYSFIDKTHSDEIQPKTITPWFKLMNMKTGDLEKIINKRYKIDRTILLPYILILPDIITDSPEFARNFNSNAPFRFEDETKIKLIKFQQNYGNLFNDLIMKINDA